MAVREPILKELLAYEKAKSEAGKEAHRRRLRELFESIGAEAAEPFRTMLSTPNALAVTFRGVLKDDPLQNELLGVLGKKFAPVSAQCTPPEPSPAPPSGVTLPAVTLTDEGSFSELHAVLAERTQVIRGACERIVRFPPVKTQLLKLVEVLSERLTQAQRAKGVVFAETDATKRAAGLKKVGDVYTGLLYVTELWKLYVIAVATDWADAARVPSSFADKPEQNPLAVRLADFEGDKALVALTQAGLDADTAAMAAALPAASQAYERHVTSLDRWIASIGRGAFLSKKVIQVADIAMIAISIYQVAKMPVVPAGGSPTPPTILGVLPGGVAVGSVVSLPSLASMLEAIRKLVALGALDGALIAGVGSLGGGPSVALPELQRPTSLSVQGSSGPAEVIDRAGKTAADNLPVRGASKKVATPTMKGAGKVADEAPTSVPKNWSKADVEDAIADYERSIRVRKAEAANFDAVGGGHVWTRKAHYERIVEEENFLKQLRKHLEDLR